MSFQQTLPYVVKHTPFFCCTLCKSFNLSFFELPWKHFTRIPGVLEIYIKSLFIFSRYYNDPFIYAVSQRIVNLVCSCPSFNSML